MSSAREQCYERRDAFYRCAADSAAAPAPPASPTASSAAAANANANAPLPLPTCAEARAQFEAGCPRAWVKYWDERVKRGQPLKTPGS